MQDCNIPSLKKLGAKIADNAVSKASAIGDFFSDTVGESLGELLGSLKDVSTLTSLSGTGSSLLDIADILKTNVINSVISQVQGIPLHGGISTFGTFLATILTAGDLARLSLAIFLTGLLRFELQRRIIITEILKDDVEKIIDLVNILMSARSGMFDGAKLSGLEKAYDHITKARTLTGEAQNQIRKHSYYAGQRIDSAQVELKEAKIDMKTPIADALIQVVEDAHLFSANTEVSAAYFKDMDSLAKDIWGVGQTDTPLSGWDKLQKEKRGRIEKRATQAEQFETIKKALAEYLNVPKNAVTAISEAKKIIGDFAKHLAKYLPLEPKKFFQMSKEIYGVYKKTEDLWKKDHNPLTAIESATDDLIESMGDRNLYNLNHTIRQRAKFMRNYGNNHERLKGMAGRLLPSIIEAYNMIDELRDDMAKHVSKQASIIDVRIPGRGGNILHEAKTIGQTAILSAKMSIWKQKINVIYDKLENLQKNTKVFDQIGQEYDKLDLVLDRLQEIHDYYEPPTEDEKDKRERDGNAVSTYIVEAEVAYKLLTDLLEKDLWAAMSAPKKLSHIQSTLSEINLSLGLSMQQDEDTIRLILNFSDGIQNIQGLKETVEILEKVLNPEKILSIYQKELINRVRMGDLEILINASMAAVAEIFPASKQIYNKAKEYVTNVDLPDVGSISPIMDISLSAVGAAIADLGRCLSMWGNSDAVSQQQAQKDIHMANEKLKTENGTLQQAIADNNAIEETLERQYSLRSGTAQEKTVPETDDITSLTNSIEDTFVTLNIKTSEEIIMEMDSTL